uniref:Uncharacterized protein n=1 Tax=Tetranychus urticae TaxID=32264 RepID=T1KY34_TETUR
MSRISSESSDFLHVFNNIKLMDQISEQHRHL